MERGKSAVGVKLEERPISGLARDIGMISFWSTDKEKSVVRVFNVRSTDNVVRGLRVLLVVGVVLCVHLDSSRTAFIHSTHRLRPRHRQ